MASVRRTIEVPVPVEEVYEQWTRFESFPAFMEGVTEVRHLDERRLRWRALVGGRETEWEAEITELIPDTRVAWRSISGRPNSGAVDFYRLDDSHTEVSLQMDADPEGVTEKVGDELEVLDRQVQSALERFRDFVVERSKATAG